MNKGHDKENCNGWNGFSFMNLNQKDEYENVSIAAEIKVPVTKETLYMHDQTSNEISQWDYEF